MLLAATVLLASSRLALAQDLASVEREAAQLVQAQPSAINWQKLGLSRYLQNKYQPAIDALKEAVRRDSALWASHLFLGISLYRTNQFPMALESLERADRLAPDAADGRDDVDYWLGATQIALRRPLRGLQSLERLLARSPRHREGLQLSTETYAATASELWNRVAERAFHSAAGQEVHGYALENEGNRPGALAAFRRSQELSPKRPGPGVALGRLLLSDGDTASARQVLAHEMRIDPVSPEAHLYWGLLALRDNRPDQAVAPLEWATTWLAQSEEPPLALCQAYLALGDAPKAVRAAQRAVAANNVSLPAHELLLAALATAGDGAALEIEKQRWAQRKPPN